MNSVDVLMKLIFLWRTEGIHIEYRNRMQTGLSVLKKTKQDTVQGKVGWSRRNRAVREFELEDMVSELTPAC